MRRASVRSDQPVQAPLAKGGMAVDGHLLVAVGAVLIAAAAERVAQFTIVFPPLGRLLSYITHGLLGLAVLYCLFELSFQWITTSNDAASARSVSASAACGSFLLGVVAILFVGNSQASLLFAGIGMGISIIALFSFLLSGSGTTTGEFVRNDLQETELLPGPVSSKGVVVPQSATFQPDTELAEEVLPQLFVNDPLYSVPQLRTARLFMQVKSNDLPVNCEDACAASADETRFALCDGTSSSSLPRPWATLLAQQWVKQPLHDINAATLAQWLEEPRQRWKAWVYETWLPTLNSRNRATGSPPLSISRAHEVVKNGAFSTFLGVTVDRKMGEWWATAIGDTCLFVFHSNATAWQLQYSFPLQSLREFNDTPPSINSHSGSNVDMLLRHVRQAHGACRGGDVLVMATDAMAAWFLKQIEQGASEWQMLQSLNDTRRFAQLVDTQRYRGQLHDDDVTLIVIPV
jgi:hypothetical protein